MRSESNEWQPDEREVEHLSPFGKTREVISAIGILDGIAPWLIGLAAGFSPGKTTDEAKRRSNLSSAVSKATKKNRQLLPHIRALQEQLQQFRQDGGDVGSISWKDKVERLEFVIRHGNPSESLRAIQQHNAMLGDGERPELDTRRTIKALIIKHGRERALQGCREIFPELVYHVHEFDMEAENESDRSGDAEGSAAAGDSSPAGGRILGSRGDSPTPLDERRRATVGADISQRQAGSGEITARLEALEAKL